MIIISMVLGYADGVNTECLSEYRTVWYLKTYEHGSYRHNNMRNYVKYYKTRVSISSLSHPLMVKVSSILTLGTSV